MENYGGISEGIKSVANTLNSTRESSKELTKTIENIQKDGTEVALQQLEDKKKKQQHDEAEENSVVYKAVKEYKKQKALIDAENKLEKDFKAKYGAKEWNKVLELKAVVEKEQAENRKYYGHKLHDVRQVQFYCWFVAFIITCLLFYFELV
jgi:hypothetical protein